MSSTRAPLWYCHQCHAEMRPLMVPDPHCASCHGTFVEILEDGSRDDPRRFDVDIDQQDDHPGVQFVDQPDPMLFRLFFPQFARGPPSTTTNGGPQSGGGGGSGGIRVEFRPGPTGDRRMPTGGSPGEEFVHPLQELLRGLTTPLPGATGADAPPPNDLRPVLQRYFAALLAGPGGINPIILTPGEGGTGMNGQWGDYALNQEALDQIVTQLMEAAGASSRPNPAPEDLIADLPRTELTPDCPLVKTGQSCAICTEQFVPPAQPKSPRSSGKEPSSPDIPSEPSSAIAITLPCAHTFHDDCVGTWLKMSGTCPVCRFALVEQPQGHGPPGAMGGAGGGAGTGGRGRAPGAEGRGGPNFTDTWASLFGSGGPRSTGGAQDRHDDYQIPRFDDDLHHSDDHNTRPSDNNLRPMTPPPLEHESSDSSASSSTSRRSVGGTSGGSGRSGLGFGAAAGLAGRWLAAATGGRIASRHSAEPLRSSDSSSSERPRMVIRGGHRVAGVTTVRGSNSRRRPNSPPQVPPTRNETGYTPGAFDDLD